MEEKAKKRKERKHYNYFTFKKMLNVQKNVSKKEKKELRIKTGDYFNL